MRSSRLLLLLLAAGLAFCPPSRAQSISFFGDRALAPVSVLGIPQPVASPQPYAFVRVCGLPLTQSQPCLPLASITDVNGNPISNNIGSNFGQLQTDVTGRWIIGCSVNTNYQIQIQQSSSNTPFANYPITCPGAGSNPTFTSLTVTGQITSTVATGTAPFSVASTTVVPNLNSQLHNGLTSPASAIVGINDTQTLTAKTLTAPAITNPTITGGGSWAGSPSLTTPTIDGTAAGHVVQQVSAVTNYGTALGSQTIVASMPSTGNVSLIFELVQVTAGVGCSAATNSVTVNPVTYTAPGGTAESANPSSNMGFTGNGAVDSGSATFGTSAFTNNGIQAVAAKSGTSLSYTTTSTLASTGCTTTPQYVIYAKAIF